MKDLVQLDVSICNVILREKYLEALANSKVHFVGNGYLNPGEIAPKKKSWQNKFHFWLLRRSISVESLTFYIHKSDDFEALIALLSTLRSSSSIQGLTLFSCVFKSTKLAILPNVWNQIFEKLPNLTYLGLIYCSVLPQSSINLGKPLALSKLQQLRMHNCKIYGSSFSEIISKCSKLYNIVIQDCVFNKHDHTSFHYIIASIAIKCNESLTQIVIGHNFIFYV